jgi:hypothetical protein
VLYREEVPINFLHLINTVFFEKLAMLCSGAHLKAPNFGVRVFIFPGHRLRRMNSRIPYVNKFPSIGQALHTHIHIVTCITDYRRGFDLMIGILNTLFTQVGTTGNMALLLIYTLYSSPLHTHTRVLSLH